MAYLHKLNPFAVEISKGIGIRWYGLAYLSGILFGYALVACLSRKKLTPLEGDRIGDFVFAVAMGTILGGRLGYCIFYAPELFLQLSSSFPFWGPLAINQGGMASHGGIAGIALACIYFGWKHGISIPHLGDLCTFGGTVGIFFGRIANFINGELVGRPSPPGYPWAVKFPQDILAWPSQEPERLVTLAPVAEKVGISPERWSDITAAFHVDPSAWSSLHRALDRMVDAVQSGNSAVVSAIEPLLTERYPSQLIASFLEGALVFALLALIWRKPRKPGVITGWFFVIYAGVRIISERYRMPDVQIGFELFGLTRGQWLSIWLLAIGGVCLLAWARRPVEKMGGWGRSTARSPDTYATNSNRF